MQNFPQSTIFHFMALGGIGMSGLAKILIEAGYKVSGSDISKNSLTDYLEKQGAQVYIGHKAENIAKDCSMVIKSTAIMDDNPELQEAIRRNLPIMHRSELLNALMTSVSIGITGTHGKTTTTGMITTVFKELGLDPSFSIGGEIPQLKTNAAYGKGGYFIAELDESDRSIELYTPDLTVITNLEFDHPEHYPGGFEQLIEVFKGYIEKLSPESKIVINIDDVGNNVLLKQVQRKVITYSLKNSDADFYVDESLTVYKQGKNLGKLKLSVPGTHNISNALAVIASTMQYCDDFDKIAAALTKFTGMKKRFQTICYAKDAQIIDDYAHHPTEVRATIETAKSITNGRVIAVFQPHRYTRLASLWDDFLTCFEEADMIYVCDVYSAQEPPIDGVSSEEFTQQLKKSNAYYIKGELDNVAQAILREIRAKDIVLTMGAGNITNLGRIIDEYNNKA